LTTGSIIVEESELDVVGKMACTMTKVNTLFGSFDEDQLKKLKGYVDELVLHMNKNQANSDAMKDIVDVPMMS
jgi:hypothetical protein